MAIFRTLFPKDTDQLKTHYLRLDPADRTLRFCGRVSDASIETHCDEIDWSRAGIVGGFIEGVLRGVAELHADRAWLASHGEVGISVERDWQRRGIGTELLRRMLGVARNRTLRTLSLACIAENRPMQKIARKYANALHFADGAICADIALPYPSILSLQEEAYANGLGLMASWHRAIGAATGATQVHPHLI